MFRGYVKFPRCISSLSSDVCGIYWVFLTFMGLGCNVLEILALFLRILCFSFGTWRTKKHAKSEQRMQHFDLKTKILVNFEIHPLPIEKYCEIHPDSKEFCCMSQLGVDQNLNRKLKQKHFCWIYPSPKKCQSPPGIWFFFVRLWDPPPKKTKKQTHSFATGTNILGGARSKQFCVTAVWEFFSWKAHKFPGSLTASWVAWQDESPPWQPLFCLPCWQEGRTCSLTWNGTGQLFLSLCNVYNHAVLLRDFEHIGYFKKWLKIIWPRIKNKMYPLFLKLTPFSPRKKPCQIFGSPILLSIAWGGTWVPRWFDRYQRCDVCLGSSIQGATAEKGEVLIGTS